MPENILPSPKTYTLRAKLPQYFRFLAMGATAVVLVVVLVEFYRERSKSPFKLKSEHTQLSTEVVADVNGYERSESEGGIPKYHITADHAKTFSDNHQELENVNLETFDAEGNSDNKLAAEKALFIPEEDKNFTAYLNGNVRIETRDALKIQTNNVVYAKKAETAEADEAVQFERNGIRGKAFGANVRMGQKSVDLLKDVELEAFESPELAKANIRYAKINSGSATFDLTANKFTLNDSVAVNLSSAGGIRNTDIHANRAVADFSAGGENKDRQLKSLELFDSVRINSVETAGPVTTIESGYAMYDKTADRFELKNGSHIVTTANGKPTDIRSNEAVYEQTANKLALTGGAEITQGGDLLKGDNVFATLFPDKKVRDAVIRGNASARQTTPERVTSVSGNELNATFGETRALHDANAVGDSVAEIIPVASKDYSKVTMSAAKGIGMVFKGEGLLDRLRTDGRTTIQLNAPAGVPDAANKRLTADAVTTSFNANGKDISNAEAVGNAELYIEPVNSGVQYYRTTIDAPRFACEFFPTGNDARVCEGSRKTTTVRVPTVQQEGRGKQTLVADKLTVDFDPASKDLDHMTATGSARFNELDRYALANEITFAQKDEIVRLKGGEPTGWDSKYRARAREIDWDTKQRRSYLRGGVSTTYYSLKTMDSAAPFSHPDKPVFMTADSAEFDLSTETARYTGNARGWQENNYVRGDVFTINQREGKFVAEDHVQSAAYNAHLNKKNAAETAPVFASAGSLVYLRDSRLLQYRTNADIRQGTDRITANSADIYLNESNEVSKTIAETGVVLTQPGRRATGDWVQYTSQDELAVLRGNPARVEDGENGTSQGAQLTFNMKEKRVLSEGRSKSAASGRNKSIYKIQTKQ